jgi:hypothetical protein
MDARFPSAGFLHLAELFINQILIIVGSGGVIRNSRNLNYHGIFFEGEPSP